MSRRSLAAVDRGSKSVNSPDHRPNAARVNASLKTNSGNAVSATGTDLTRCEVFFEFLPCAIRFATQHQIIRAASMVTAELRHISDMDVRA